MALYRRAKEASIDVLISGQWGVWRSVAMKELLHCTEELIIECDDIAMDFNMEPTLSAFLLSEAVCADAN